MREIEIKSDKRPWGSWYLYSNNDNVAAVKNIVVESGEILSLQSHKKREEEWYLIKGKVRVLRGKDVNSLGETILERFNDNVVIKKGELHRLENIGREEALVLEISRGEYDEEDIIRYEDKYKRV